MRRFAREAERRTPLLCFAFIPSIQKSFSNSTTSQDGCWIHGCCGCLGLLTVVLMSSTFIGDDQQTQQACPRSHRTGAGLTSLGCDFINYIVTRSQSRADWGTDSQRILSIKFPFWIWQLKNSSEQDTFRIPLHDEINYPVVLQETLISLSIRARCQ